MSKQCMLQKRDEFLPETPPLSPVSDVSDDLRVVSLVVEVDAGGTVLAACKQTKHYNVTIITWCCDNLFSITAADTV